MTPICSGPVAVQVATDDPQAARDLVSGLGTTELSLLLLFCETRDGLARLGADLRDLLPPDCLLAGCSSAGEIGPGGYTKGCAVAIGFPRDCFRAQMLVLPNLAHIPVSEWMASLRRMHADFGANPNWSTFGLLLSDGLAGQEDVLVSAIEAALPALPVIGGSAGDGLDFQETSLIVDGAVQSDIGLFILLETPLTVSEVTFAHFSPTMTRAVVTAASADKRRILELNAEPAAQEYARLTGIPLDQLTPTEFAQHPLLLRMGKRHHVRAIQSITEDGALSMLSSVDAGNVLTLGRAEDLTHGFAEAMEALPRPPLMVLGFDCILRRLALERAGLIEEMSRLFTRYRIAGFSTYGEQHSGMHVNQTFVGLAFMPPEGAAADAS